jgi:pyruvate/2-oxoglutarate/acetoin dehydrogenase E1 component
MPREITYIEAVAEAISEEIERDDDVILFGENVEDFGGNFGETTGLHETFGDNQVRNTPLDEIGIARMALGAAVGGIRPVAELQFADFAATVGDEVFKRRVQLSSRGRATARLSRLFLRSCRHSAPIVRMSAIWRSQPSIEYSSIQQQP